MTETGAPAAARQRLLAAVLCCCLGGVAAPAAGAELPRLFGTVEFRGPLKALPHWRRVVAEAPLQAAELSGCEECGAAALSWQELQRLAAGLAPIEQLRRVNAFFNRWPYRLDRDVYRVADYWATPREFLQHSGDCEDFSIAKYFALRQLGFPAESLRVVVLRDEIRGIAHAVLVVYLDEEAYVLDNLSDLVFPHSRYEHYLPWFSVNESHRWAHVRTLRPPERLGGPR